MYSIYTIEITALSFNANMNTYTTTTVFAGSVARWSAVSAHLPEIPCLEMVSYYCYYYILLNA